MTDYSECMTKQNVNGREVIIELHQIGQLVKVSAMDVQSLTEVSIQGPVTAPEEMLRRNALRRLEFVLKKKGVLK
jgi:hypothetical protein